MNSWTIVDGAQQEEAARARRSVRVTDVVSRSVATTVVAANVVLPCCVAFALRPHSAVVSVVWNRVVCALVWPQSPVVSAVVPVMIVPVMAVVVPVARVSVVRELLRQRFFVRQAGSG
jgi:hypothetical protein